MNPDQTKTPKTEAYIVIAAEMATYSATEKCFSNFHVVRTFAPDEETACQKALAALWDGYIPVAAFTRETMLDFVHELRPCNTASESYNFDMGMNAQEFREWKIENRIKLDHFKAAVHAGLVPKNILRRLAEGSKNTRRPFKTGSTVAVQKPSG